MILLTIIAAVVLFTIRKPVTWFVLVLGALIVGIVITLAAGAHRLVLRSPRAIGVILGVIVSAVCLYVAW